LAHYVYYHYQLSVLLKNNFNNFGIMNGWFIDEMSVVICEIAPMVRTLTHATFLAWPLSPDQNCIIIS